MRYDSIGLESTRISPDFGRYKFARRLTREDLPDPFVPTMTTSDDAGRVILIFSRTSLESAPPGYANVTLLWEYVS